MAIFYTPDLLITNQLSEEESLHCAKVLRLCESDEIDLIDGKGNWAKAIITMAHPKRTSFEIIEKCMHPKGWGFNLHLAMSPTKNMDRVEWFVEKATEIGIDSFTFLKTEHSERKNLNMDRLEKIVVSAMKQSKKSYKPQINKLIEFDCFIKQAKSTQRFIAHCDEDDEKKMLVTNYTPDSDVLILIGPEGDFSPQEVLAAKEAGYQNISLGTARLRTETAALYSCNVIHIINQLREKDR